MKNLFVFALESEAKHTKKFMPHHVWITGVGKINAAHSLTKAIKLFCGEIGHVINLGTAGSSVYEPGTIIQCHDFIQGDMDCTPLGCLEGETPFDNYGQRVLSVPDLLDTGLPRAEYCRTADRFSENPGELSDMESYAMAKVCVMSGVDFTSIKYVTDGGQATDWTQELDNASRELAGIVQLLNEIT